MFQIQNDLLTIQAETVFTIIGINFTSSMTSALLVTFTIILLCIIVNKTFKKNTVPAKFQLALELVVSMLVSFVDNITGDKIITKRIFPLIGGLFLYLFLANTILLIPGFSSLMWNDVSVFRANTADFNATFGIAVAMIIFTHIYSIQEHGLYYHINNYFAFATVITEFKKGISEGLISIIQFFIGILNIISEVAKSLSLSLRLFGNIFAGEMLAIVIASMFALVLPIPLIFLALFSGIIQAIVFGALTASYFSIALKEE